MFSARPVADSRTKVLSSGKLIYRYDMVPMFECRTDRKLDIVLDLLRSRQHGYRSSSDSAPSVRTLERPHFGNAEIRPDHVFRGSVSVSFWLVDIALEAYTTHSDTRVVGAILAQLIELNRLRSSRDITYDSWPYSLCTQFVQNLSVITVCIPYIKNALIGLESGMLQTGDFHLRRPSAISTLKNKSNPSSGSKDQRTVVASYNDSQSAQRHSLELNTITEHNPFPANCKVVTKSSRENNAWDEESQSSQTGIIKKTTEWRIDHTTRTNEPARPG